MHWVKNPSAIDLDLLFQPRIPDSCILEPEIVASLFKTGSGKNAGDTYFSTLCPRQSISQCERSVANAFPFGHIEALGIFKTHAHEGQASFAYEPHAQSQLQSIQLFPCLVVATASALVMPYGRCSVNFLCFNTNGYPPRQPRRSRNTRVQ
jgi:hypothetical protein